MKTKMLRMIVLQVDLPRTKMRIWTGSQSFSGRVFFRTANLLDMPLPPLEADYVVCVKDEHHTHYIEPSHISAINIL